MTPHARHRPPPEEDLKSAVHEELRAGVHDEHPSASGSVPVRQLPNALDADRQNYFTGKYTGPSGKALLDMPLLQLLNLFQVPETLAKRVVNLMAIAKAHGVAEATVAVSKDPEVDARQRDNLRRLLQSAFQDDRRSRV